MTLLEEFFQVKFGCVMLLQKDYFLGVSTTSKEFLIYSNIMTKTVPKFSCDVYTLDWSYYDLQ